MTTESLYLENSLIDEQGREAARLSDATDHGGRVVKAASALTITGISVVPVREMNQAFPFSL